jgi:hypothetical protein
MDSVPVGAMVVTAALRSGGSPRRSQRLPAKFANAPRSRASWPTPERRLVHQRHQVLGDRHGAAGES